MGDQVDRSVLRQPAFPINDYTTKRSTVTVGIYTNGYPDRAPCLSPDLTRDPTTRYDNLHSVIFYPLEPGASPFLSD